MKQADHLRILVVGCGYVGTPVAEQLAAGNEVWAVTRGDEKHAALHARGIRPISTNVTEKGWTDLLPVEVDVIVNTVSSGGNGDYRATYFKSNYDLLLKYKDAPPDAFVYTSSTSVYSQEDGSEVTEESEAEASSPMREVLLETEAILLNDIYFPSIAVLRLGGIYGPGRHAYLDDLRNGVAAFPEDPNRWINQIHRDDAVRAVLHMLQLTPRREIFNAVDDEPIHYGTCLNWLAKQIGANRPVFDPAAATTRRRRGPKPNRRISNAKLKQSGWAPLYPSFREGFSQILAAEVERLNILPPPPREVETGRVA